MAFLLTTKLKPPPVPPRLVSRPRLMDRLDESVHGKLTLVSAPAGFGKTTLLSAWVHSRTSGFGPRERIAWLSLDEGDDDPARFMAYVVAALRTVEEGLGVGVLDLLRSPQPPPIESLLTVLINDLAAVPGPWVLIFDDWHVIEARSLQRGLAFLLRHSPPRFHLMIATRVDPALPLARLRARGQLVELRAHDLRFRPEEVAAFFNQAMGLGLAADAVAALETRTEGWPAGLQMAALSLRGRDDTTDFIEAFTGSHRHVLDYLVEEVLRQQPESVRAFLLQTAILDRLNGSLCDVVLGASELTDRQIGDRLIHSPVASQATLEYLEGHNLFIVPLDSERRWYRYHRLFSDLLRARLCRTFPDRIPALHRRAAGWYRQNGLPVEAVGHAMAAGDFDGGADLIEQVAPVVLWQRGEIATFLGWLEELPEEWVRARPRLGLYHAWALLTAVQLDGVEARLEDIECALGDAAATEVRGEMFIIRAMVANFRGDQQRTIELSSQALDVVPEDSLFLRTTLAGNLGGAYLVLGDAVRASQAFEEASRLGQAVGHAFTTLVPLCFLGNTQALRGQLHRAAQTYRRALELVEARGRRRVPLAGMAYVWLGDVLREWNDLDEAIRDLETGIELTRMQGDRVMGPSLQVLVDGYVSLARAHQARGNQAVGLVAIEKAQQVVQSRVPSLAESVGAARARLCLEQGDVGAAARWAQGCGLSLEDQPAYQREFEYLILAQVRIAQGRPADVMALLERLLRAAEAGGRMRSVVEILAIQAVALNSSGLQAEAMDALERALSLAEPEGYVRTFVNQGAGMVALLRRALSHSVVPEYVAELLEAFDTRPPPDPHALVEPLSEREIQVLGLIADGLSNREIGERLFIAVTTVKKHVSNIFGKLSVHSRTQATARARELDLL